MARAVNLSVDDEAGLVKAATSYWSGREHSGKAALVALDILFRRLAKHRDSNGLQVFFAGAKAAKQDAIVRRLIFHVFGGKLALAKGKSNHPTKVSFVIGWQGEYDLDASNSYSTIKAAIDKGLSWDDVSLYKSLSKPDPKVKTVDPARYQAEAKRIAKMLDKLAQEGLLVGDILSAADKLREVRNAPAQKAAKPLPRKPSADVVEMAA